MYCCIEGLTDFAKYVIQYTSSYDDTISKDVVWGEGQNIVCALTSPYYIL